MRGPRRTGADPQGIRAVDLGPTRPAPVRAAPGTGPRAAPRQCRAGVSRSPALAAYLALSRGAGPVAPLLLAARARRGKEDPARIGERLGRPSAPRPPGPLIWLHGASLGEAVSLLPLLPALARAAPDAGLLLTSGTVAAARRLSGALPGGAIHQYAPVDTARAVRRFLDHWRPSLAIRAESELWPRMLVEAARRTLPVALVNARLSARSAARWARLPGMARALFAPLALAVTQDAETAARLAGLGADPARVRQGANLKSAVAVPEAPADALARARAAVAGRRVWLAASTHPGEEAAAAAAQATLAPETLLVLAPRHPDRGTEIAADLAAHGLSAARRSHGEAPGPATRVWLVDTLGEMGLWYRLAEVVFVGGSLAPHGGHTPFEPAALGPAILHGPHTENFGPAYAALAAEGGAMRIAGDAALGPAVARLMADPDRRREMAAAAARVRVAMTPDLEALAGELAALMRPAPG